MSDITIDGKEYKKEKMSDEQLSCLALFLLNQTKETHLLEADKLKF